MFLRLVYISLPRIKFLLTTSSNDKGEALPQFLHKFIIVHNEMLM